MNRGSGFPSADQLAAGGSWTTSWPGIVDAMAAIRLVERVREQLPLASTRQIRVSARSDIKEFPRPLYSPGGGVSNNVARGTQVRESSRFSQGFAEDLAADSSRSCANG